MTNATLYRSLADFILSRKPAHRPVIVGINGVDGSGKTVLAEGLSGALRCLGRPAHTISVDGFHHPRERRYRRGEQSPEAYYHDTIDYMALAEEALKPVARSKTFPVRCMVHHFDLARNVARR